MVRVLVIENDYPIAVQIAEFTALIVASPRRILGA